MSNQLDTIIVPRYVDEDNVSRVGDSRYYSTTASSLVGNAANVLSQEYPRMSARERREIALRALEVARSAMYGISEADDDRAMERDIGVLRDRFRDHAQKTYREAR